ncbi:hypothetical protein 8F11_9 [uncultured Caudovirales phage]|uniref:Uncharacterized protein n=1 Tax=uncultured Caudovirales phage TaxID=2100421 RepID=A0A2H4IZJ9_9CAUD|nr:hypothetical protein 8F11_9 [uncultured Caudovirales phage]
MKKFPVISNGIEYSAEIVTSAPHIGIAVDIYLCDERVYTFIDAFRKYKNDYVGMVKASVCEYERRKSAQEEKKRIESENIRKFEEWDGDCRE